jgi:NADH-quinone oxidoreductase subunit G
MGGERYGELRLITNRYHPEVNGYFICDRGRFGYEYVNHENRVYQPLIRNRVSEAVSITELTEHVKKLLTSSGKIIGIGSSRASVESNYALQKITGKENFFKGFTDTETNLLDYLLQLMHSGKFDLPSQKQIEQSDAIIIIGEDLTNSAPMLALAVRQALFKTAVQKDVRSTIPVWHDSAVRNLVQEDKGYLCVLNTYREELSELADEKYYASPKAITEMVKKIIALLKGETIQTNDTQNREETLANNIVQQLRNAKNPVVITGTSCYSLSLIRAAADLAATLKNEKQKGGISFVVPECNSIGLAMMQASSVQSLIDDAQPVSDNATLVVLENDLYRRFAHQKLETFFKKFKEIIVLDSLHNQTTQQATVLIPAATFAEANGTVINHEGRAQAFYKILVNRPPQIRASWHWLGDLISVKTIELEKQMKSHLSVLYQLVSDLPQFSGVEKLVANALSEVNGHLHIPMEPHRYSGRTAILANITVHEPKPVRDEESIFSTTMEGERQLPPSPLTPFYWWPGWNSEQALNHYQREVGGLLQSETGDIKLLNGKFVQSNIEPVAVTKQEQQEDADGLWLYPRYHLFGSDEFSVYTGGIAELSPKAYICVNTNEAAKQNWKDKETIELNISERKFQFEVKIEDDVADGIAFVPYGIKETYGIEYPVRLK